MNQPATSMTESTPREYGNYHVYGGKGALDFSPSMTRGSEASPAKPTLMIEGAKAKAPRVYDWTKGKKISVQLTMQELPVVAAVLLGIRTSCEFKNHGEQKNKWFSIENQGGKFFIKVGMAAEVVAVPVIESDAFYVTQIVLDQLCAARPSYTRSDMILLLSRLFRTA